MYGDRAYGRTVTVINRLASDLRAALIFAETSSRSVSSEVVGRPLAALLANDGARVFSVDIDSIQVCTRSLYVLFTEHIYHSPGV
jgi:methylenetetrahydrofolate dehydrogenase (NAD+)